MSRVSVASLLPVLLLAALPVGRAQPQPRDELPRNLRVVLEGTRPLSHRRGGRLPLYVLPITHRLAGVDDGSAERALRELDRRGIGYTVDWRPKEREKVLAEGLRIGRMQQRLGLRVAVNANDCMYSFFDGTERTLHVDGDGKTFADTSFGRKLGCPFAIAHRRAVIKERVEFYLRGYRDAGIRVDFALADWEVDGPIEWNDAWASSKRCRRCREHVPDIDDFRAFQRSLRKLRAEMQRETLGDNVTSYFPEALVGNYGVYPHDGHRYWYDYFEREAVGVPFRQDQRARYREWYDGFGETGYTFAMPVVYTWYRTFSWYDFEETDYRWLYNMLLVGSNAGKHTPRTTPIIPFVHWTTTNPPRDPDPAVRQLSKERYRELLWHLLLRGHDTFFLWCAHTELETEIALVHEVYSSSLRFRGFLERGTPVTFDVSARPGPVVSGLQLGKRVLVLRSEFGENAGAVHMPLDATTEIVVPLAKGPRIVDVRQR